MHRRKVVKTLATALSVPIAEQLSPLELFAFGRELQGRLQGRRSKSRYIFKSLDPHQNRTVTEISELIIPQTDTPGAKAARVNEFIDLILTEWFSTEERDHFLKGLRELDRESRKLTQRSFIDTEPDQQIQLLEAQEEAAIASRRGLNRDELQWGAFTQSMMKRHFFDVMKWMTLFGYFTSEVGMVEETGHKYIHASYDGCVPLNR